VRAKLETPTSTVMFNAGDVTLPDLLLGEKGTMLGSIVVMNATTGTLGHVYLKIEGLGENPTVVELPSLLPASVRKVAFSCPWSGELPEHRSAKEAELRLSLTSGVEAAAKGGEVTLKLSVREPWEKHKRTFVSDIDGSVQYYAVVPPPEGTDLSTPKALILSLHGASVEATNQANCYKQRDWCYVVCPTNRRPYGFDWEDWGRTDAFEVLAEARKQFKLDDRRTYLTGHSMGGHGTWNIGVQYPGTFAAIGPSAGWISFWSYAGGANRENVTDVEKILLRAACTSDTLAMKQNLAQQGVYILHGDVDDNVPVAQARQMREELGKFHPDFCYHEQPGASHWWGDQCVDWDPMIEFFRRHEVPAEKDVTRVEFTTVNPDVSGTCHWVRIAQQIKKYEPSRVEMSVDREKRRFTAKTENVGELVLDLWPVLNGSGAVAVEIDGQSLENLSWGIDSKAGQGVCDLVREGDKWVRMDGSGNQQRGLFKTAFTHQVVLVYGTKGSDAENAAMAAKARFDAEQFWYRGNGNLRILSDTEYRAKRSRYWDHLPAPHEGDPEKFQAERQTNERREYGDVILYGNADTNAAWSIVLGDACPIGVRNGVMKVGDKELKGDDLACVLLYPMKDDSAMVGVVGGTGLAGMRLTDRLPYFVSGVGVPDWVVMTPELLTKGAAGVKGAGFFGNDWSVEKGEGVWAE
jgi:poly(3-hydroxybutyrate) depolymerase